MSHADCDCKQNHDPSRADDMLMKKGYLLTARKSGHSILPDHPWTPYAVVALDEEASAVDEGSAPLPESGCSSTTCPAA
jgi:hypothetical protein